MVGHQVATPGELLRLWRTLSRATIQDVADHARIDPSLLCRLERGQRPLRVPQAVALLAALQATGERDEGAPR